MIQPMGSECIEWMGTLNYSGYGIFSLTGIRPGHGVTIRAHRMAYEMLVGPIPLGLVIDHLCRNRRCVNPEHLEAVTDKENRRRGESLQAKNARKTHCKHGHQLEGANVRVVVRPGRTARRCIACAKAASARR